MDKERGAGGERERGQSDRTDAEGEPGAMVGYRAGERRGAEGRDRTEDAGRVEVFKAAEEGTADWMKGLAGNLVLVMAGPGGRVPLVRVRGEARR
jgi:hypothetical protein